MWFVATIINIDIAETECLTMAIYYEAGNQTQLGKTGVGSVIRNRMEHRRFPDSYCDVIKQRSQFTFYWDGLPEPMPKKDNRLEREALDESRWVAWMIMFNILPDPTNGSYHYHNDTIEKPKSWTRMVHSVTLDNHNFYTGL